MMQRNQPQPTSRKSRNTTMCKMLCVRSMTLRRTRHSTIQPTMGMSRRITWMSRLCELNHLSKVIFYILLIIYAPKIKALFITSLQEQLFEQQYPNAVNPTEDYTWGDSYQNADDQPYKAALFKECRPSHNNFNDPVDNGDEQQKKLNQTALPVKQSHFPNLLILIGRASRPFRAWSAQITYIIYLYYITLFSYVKVFYKIL